MIKTAVCFLILFIVVSFVPAQRRSRTVPATKSDRRAQPAGGDLMNVPPPPPAAKPTPKEEDEVVRVETNLVTTPVSVLDRNGRFIPGLTKKDFKIFENGVPQKITYFQSSEQPFTVFLMIDTSPSTRYKIDEIHYAALTFVNQLRPTDKVVVIAFDGRLRILTEPTVDKATIFSAIYKAQFGSGTSLYDAVDYVASLDLVKALGRKAVVLFTDGVDTTSRRATFSTSVAAVEEVDALFYPIRYDTHADGTNPNTILQGYGLPAGVTVQLNRGQSAAEYEVGKSFLELLALNSGGRIFEADSITNLDAAFAGVAEELRRQYSIGYYANEDGQPGDRKKIKIEVARPPKAVIRAKTNYVVKDRSGGPGPSASGAEGQ